MKNSVTILCFLITSFGLSTLQAQPFDKGVTDNSKPKKDSQERLYFSFGIGPRIHQTMQGNVSTYLESETNLTNYTSIFKGVQRFESRLVLTGFQVKMGYTQSIGLSHHILLDFTLGKNRAFFGGYSVGWEVPLLRKKMNINIRPGLAFLLGYTRFFIGELSNTDLNGYIDSLGNIIQIGSARYFSSRLELFMTQDGVSAIYGPEVAFNFTPNRSNTGFQFSAGYYLGSQAGDAVIIFDPLHNNHNGVAKTSSLSVNSDVLAVFYNDKPVQQNLFNYHGLRCTASITFDF